MKFTEHLTSIYSDYESADDGKKLFDQTEGDLPIIRHLEADNGRLHTRAEELEKEIEGLYESAAGASL